MKKLFVILIFCLFTLASFSQKLIMQNNPYYDRKPVHFGFTIGLAAMDFNVYKTDVFVEQFMDTNSDSTIYDINMKRTMGFVLGPISNFRINDYLDFRMLINFSFGQRNLQYSLMVNNELVTHDMKIGSTYLEIPLLFKYKALRLNNYRPYIVFGVNPKYDLAARKKVKEEEMPKIRLQQIDVCGDIGLGTDIYLPYFKLGVELKYSQGFLNMVKKDDTKYTKSIDKLQSKMVFLSFHFE